MKVSLMIATLLFYSFMNCILFGFTEANIGYALAWVLITIFATWIFNYIIGSISILFRDDHEGHNKIHPLYWVIYFLIMFTGFTIGSIVACYGEN